MIVVSVSTILTPDYLHALILSASVGTALVGAFHANAIGRTGPGFILEAMALTGRRALRGYFSGQDIALGLIGVPLLTAVSFALAAVAGHPADGFLGLAVDLAGIGAGLGLANILTVFTALPVERRAGSPRARAADGYIGYAYAGAFGSLLGVAAAVSPVILGVAPTGSDPAMARIPVLVLCAAGYGIALAWIGVRFAARAAEQKLPELSQIAVRSKL
jgi:ABC-2 type transport system permease protein